VEAADRLTKLARSRSGLSGRLTIRGLAALEPQPRRYYVWDGGIPGFGVRVTERGVKAFVLTYRLKSGRPRLATLGRVGKITLDKARELARSYLGTLAGGEDPLRRIDLARTAPTLGDVADRFLKDHVTTRCKPATLRLYQLAINRHLRPALGAVAIVDVSPADMLRLHHRLRATPYIANRVLAVCSKLMNWAEQHGYRPTNANPCRGVQKFREESRRRYLTPRELQRLGTALRIAEKWESMSPIAVTAIRLLLLTGARVSEILTLRWRDVNLARGELQLADSKTGRKTIVLNPPAVAILKAWSKHAGSPYVFPGEGRGSRKGQHRVNLTDAWAWIRKRARLQDVRLHDLRHSFASVAVSGGQTLPVIGALLGHTQAATTQRYAHLMDDPLRAASNATGAAIAAALASRRAQ
jgi:integrase